MCINNNVICNYYTHIFLYLFSGGAKIFFLERALKLVKVS